MGKDQWLQSNREGNWRGGFGRGGYDRGGFRGGSRGRGFGGNRDGNRFNSNNQWPSRPKNKTPGKRLSEAQIGVTEYMSEHEGFNGIIKSRYSDFQVAEINEQGEVARLTTLEHPKLPPEEQVQEDEELLLSKYNVEILPMETWNQINKVALGTASEAVEIDVSTLSKEERTKIHDAVKKAFADSIVGSTVNTEDKKLMRFAKYKKGVRIDNRVKWTWPAEYVYFVVHKVNCDTMEAAVRIAERLKMHIKPSMIGYAGTKDRRAKTSQWFSLRKVDPRKIAAACRDMQDIYVGDYSFKDQNLKLGMLKGNKFRIALRNVTADDAVINAACERLRDNGFINYYGLQRFGTNVDVPTFEIGLKLIKGNYKECVEAILEARSGALAARFRAAGAAAARPALPRRACAEAAILRVLAKRPNDYLTAIMKIPRNTRLLYLHSYQSLVWNRCVSERVRRLGLAPAAGDLLPRAPLPPTEEEAADVESDNEENEKEREKDAPEKPVEKKPKEPEAKMENMVKVLTQEDVDSKKYTIFDIVMPLPGYAVEYPPNMKDYYEMLLTNDGLTLDLKQTNNRSCSVRGAYRRVAARAGGVAWAGARYSEPAADLLPADIDLVRREPPAGPCPDGKYKAVLLSMSLPPSCYATMALRELLKVDTATDVQAAQNNYHKRKHSDSDEENSEDGKRVKDNSQDEKKDKGNSEDEKKDEDNNQDEKKDKDNSEDEKTVKENSEDEKKMDEDV